MKSEIKRNSSERNNIKNSFIVLITIVSLILSVCPVSATSTSAEQNAAITIYSAIVASYATALGYDTEASGDYSFAIGRLTIANEQDSFAAGYSTFADGIAATAMGYDTTASGTYSTATGYNTVASGYASTAMGSLTRATGAYSFALGLNTTANETNSTAIGTNLVSAGKHSIALGNELIVTGDHTVAVGLNDFPGFIPTIDKDNIFAIVGGSLSVDAPNIAATSKLAIGSMPNSPPDASGNDGVLCITNDGNVWVDDDGTYDCA